MTILLWVIFGIINGLIIHQLDSSQNKGSGLIAALFGIGGALSGGIAAYYLFGGEAATLNIISIIILALEGGVLILLLKGRAFRQPQIQ